MILKRKFSIFQYFKLHCKKKHRLKKIQSNNFFFHPQSLSLLWNLNSPNHVKYLFPNMFLSQNHSTFSTHSHAISFPLLLNRPFPSPFSSSSTSRLPFTYLHCKGCGSILHREIRIVILVFFLSSQYKLHHTSRLWCALRAHSFELSD